MDLLNPGQAHILMEKMVGGENSQQTRSAHLVLAERLYCNNTNYFTNYSMMNPGYGMMGDRFGIMGFDQYNYNPNMMGSNYYLKTNFWHASTVIFGIVFFRRININCFRHNIYG